MKKSIFLLICLISISYFANAQTSGSFLDPRDGKSYNWVVIGNQTWMAENLAYEPKSGDCFIFETEDSTLQRYGYHYNWETANKVCPSGWHLPESGEFIKLASFVGSNPGKKLKAKTGWLLNGDGTDEYSFSALPSGNCSLQGKFTQIGYLGFWWSATKAEPTADGIPTAMLFYISCGLDSVDATFSQNINVGVSVRCIKDK